MKTLFLALTTIFLLASCDQKNDPEAQAEPEPAAENQPANEADDEEDFDALKDKSCEEFYSYVREVCLKSIKDGLDQSCYLAFTRAHSARKTMAGEVHAKRTAKLSEEQKVKAFCGRPYSKLAEKVAEASTEARDLDSSCDEVVEMIDKKCLKPMAAGKESQNDCGSALQTVSKWEDGKKWCERTRMLLSK